LSHPRTTIGRVIADMPPAGSLEETHLYTFEKPAQAKPARPLWQKLIFMAYAYRYTIKGLSLIARAGDLN
jgi:hypothetical protein